MSVLQLRALDKDAFFSKKEESWLAEAKQMFSRIDRVPALRWLMIRKKSVPGSNCKTWIEQQKVLKPSERVPNAAEVAYVLALYRKVRDIRLLSDELVRTSSTDCHDQHVVVGHNEETGMSIIPEGDIHRSDKIGILTNQHSSYI